MPHGGGPLVETVRWKLGSGIPWGTVTDGAHVYFVAGNVTGHYDLLKVPVGEGASETLVSDPTRIPGPLAVGNGMVFWINQPDPGTIMRTPTSGGLSEALASGLTGFVREMLVDSEALYWIEIGSGAIRKVALTGGPVITLRPERSNAGYPTIAQDESFIYWTDEWSVGKVPKVGGQLFFYQADYDIRMTIGVDDTSVYWVTNYALMRTTPK